MTIVNFSKILPENPNVYTFNPSISYWKDNLYLCVYRRFVRYPKLYQNNFKEYTEKSILDPNHPWLGGPMNDLPEGSQSFFWSTIGFGYDNTGICLLEIDKYDNVEKIIDYNYGNNVVNIEGNFIEKNEMIKGQDARLLYIGNNEFIVSYNTNVSDIKIKDDNCQEGCYLIATRLIKIKDDRTLILGDEIILCPEISNRTEKNWSFWNISDNLFFSYGLYPSHDVFSIKNNNFKLECNSIMSMTNKNSFFEKFIKRYEPLGIFISVTTPAIKFYKNSYIGVGHIKYKYNDVENIKNIKGSPLEKFTNNMKQQNKQFHPIYVYLMFFYIFDIKTLSLQKISYMFLPYSSAVLCFPSGITQKPNKQFLITYGDADSSSNFFTISSKNILSMCGNNIKNPKTIDFKMIK